MSGLLLDTNAVSEFMRPTPDQNVLTWLRHAHEEELSISVLTLGEIRKGVEKLAYGRRRFQLESWLENDLRTRFSERTLPVNAAISDRWGLLDAQSRRNGRPLSTVDGLLAATALEHNLTLVTRNTRDFESVPVSVVSPWEP